MSIWKRKPLAQLLAEAADSEKGLKRTLTAWSLIALGIGAIIGAGLFVRTAMAASQNAGPSVTIAFVLAAVGCALAGLCYAELSSSIPISGSAYTYSYVAFGELIAWIIGWALIMEYAIGNITVAISWSDYFTGLLDSGGIHLPQWIQMDYLTACFTFFDNFSFTNSYDSRLMFPEVPWQLTHFGSKIFELMN